MYFEYAAHVLLPPGDHRPERCRPDPGEAGRLCRRQGPPRSLVVFVPSKDRIYLDRTRFAADAAPRRWRENDLPDRLAAVVRREDPGEDSIPT